MVDLAVSDIGPEFTMILRRLFEHSSRTKQNAWDWAWRFSRSIVEAHGGKLTAEPETRWRSIFRYPAIGERPMQLNEPFTFWTTTKPFFVRWNVC